MYSEAVTFLSLGERLAARLFLPEASRPVPALIICHGALEFKEDFFELCEFLASQGIAALALDMHGHGESEGERYHVEMRTWAADVRAAVDFLEAHPAVDRQGIGAFGLSSGGTAILEAALLDPRLKTLIALDATVRSSLKPLEAFIFQTLILAGRIKRFFTGRDLRFSAISLFAGVKVASDPQVNQQVRNDARLIQAFSAFPLPGAAECFFVDTLRRVGRIVAPTLVLWGEDDELDPPESGHLLYAALTCKKRLEIIPGNGHMGHLDRHKESVFRLTAEWALENLTPQG